MVRVNPTLSRYIAWLTSSLALAAACAPQAPPPVTATPATPDGMHHHELPLPPVGPTIRVTLAGKSVEIPVSSLPNDGGSAPLVSLWKAAWPTEDPLPLHFDVWGSDGFHPAARPPCAARLLTGAEVALARIDLATHDISFDKAVGLPGCYHVHAVVALDGVR